MLNSKLSETEWQIFLDLADRLEIPMQELVNGDVRFAAIEAAGHRLGRAVAQATTERLVLAQAERIMGLHPCPTCPRRCPVVHQMRTLETVDGPMQLAEPVCYCSDCRRDFFPSASAVGT